VPTDAPAAWSVRFARADLLVAEGRPEEASALLAPSAPAALEALRRESLARAHARAGNAEGMRAAVRELRALAAGSGPRLAANATLLGHLEASLGNVGRAYQAFEEAARLDPECDALRALGQLAAREGDHARAADAFSELCRGGRPEDPDCAEADRERRLERERP
jgi:tetratricopeptide (TPR) repeat protein